MEGLVARREPAKGSGEFDEHVVNDGYRDEQDEEGNQQRRETNVTGRRGRTTIANARHPTFGETTAAGLRNCDDVSVTGAPAWRRSLRPVRGVGTMRGPR